MLQHYEQLLNNQPVILTSCCYPALCLSDQNMCTQVNSVCFSKLQFNLTKCCPLHFLRLGKHFFAYLIYSWENCVLHNLLLRICCICSRNVLSLRALRGRSADLTFSFIARLVSQQEKHFGQWDTAKKISFCASAHKCVHDVVCTFQRDVL